MKKELKDRIVNLFDIFNVCESLFTQRRKKEFINLFNITANIADTNEKDILNKITLLEKMIIKDLGNNKFFINYYKYELLKYKKLYMENTDLFDFKVDNSVFEYNKNTFFTNMNYLKSNIINKIKQYESYNHYFDKIKSYSPYIYDYEYLKELETINQTVYQSDINDDFNEYEIKLSLEENVNLKMKFDEPDDMISKIRKSLKKDEELNDRMSNCNSNNDFLLFLNNYKTNRNENNKIKARYLLSRFSYSFRIYIFHFFKKFTFNTRQSYINIFKIIYIIFFKSL